MLPTNWLFGSGEAKKKKKKKKKKKNDFQAGRHGGHLVSPIGTILAIFDLQVALMLPTQLQVNWPFYSEEPKNRVSRWPPLGFQIGTILAIFDLQVTPMLSTKFRVSWPFGSGEETKNTFSSWPVQRSSWFVCIEVLRSSQPNGAMSSAVSLPNTRLVGRLRPLSG